MNTNETTYPMVRPTALRTRIVVSISSQLFAEGLKCLLVSRGHSVEVIGMESDFGTISEKLASDSFSQTVWVLDMKTLLAIAPVSKREIVRNQTILIADLSLGRKSRNYLADAAAIVSMESSYDELDMAIRSVAQGIRYFDQRLSHFRVEEFNGTSPNLTARQLQVLKMVADGMSSRKIANELLLSRRTVENHRARILERLGVSNAAEMIDVARNKKWI